MKLPIELLSKAALELDPLPEISRTILERILKTQPVWSNDLVDFIKLDPALCLKLLYLSNTHTFGDPGRVGCIEQIVETLEPEIILDSLMSQVSRISLHPKPSLGTLNDQRLFWKHSLACARFSEVLARKMEFPNPSVAYLAGLLHDFAKMILYQKYPKLYQSIFDLMDQEQIHMFEAERRILGDHHAMIASKVLELWNVPPWLRAGIVSHHVSLATSNISKPEELLAGIVKTGDTLTYKIREGDGGDSARARSDPLVKEMKPLLVHLDAEVLNREKSALEGIYQQIRLGQIDSDHYIQLLAEANRNLGRRSIELRNNLRDISLLHQIHQVFQLSQSTKEVFLGISQELSRALHALAVAFLIEESHGNYIVYVSSGCELDDAVLYNLKSLLCRHFSSQVRTSVDPSLLRVEQLRFQETRSEEQYDPNRILTSSAFFVLDGQMGILGVLGLFSDQPWVFSEEERERYQIVFELMAMGLDRQRLEYETRQMSMTDGLTGLFNHRQFEILLDNELKKSDRYGNSIALIILDIDFFKKVNDTYGHLAGDQVLREVSALLKTQTRDSDLLARYGGEEFAIVLCRMDPANVVNMAERIRKSIEVHTFCTQMGHNLKVTVSQGVCCYPAQGIHDALQLIEASDTALYEAKRTGRNRVIQAPNAPVTEK